MAPTRTIITARQLLEESDLGRCELIRGEIIPMTPASPQHGRIETRLASRLDSFVQANGLGEVYSGDVGFQIEQDPDTVRAPDIAFVRWERAAEAPEEGFFQGPPDLAVEVVSPNDRLTEAMAKVQDWLGAGCAAVWLVDPRTQRMTVFQEGRTSVLKVGDRLTGGELLPGFELPIAEIFERTRRPG
jgi:Uma2 family endonuclease